MHVWMYVAVLLLEAKLIKFKKMLKARVWHNSNFSKFVYIYRKIHIYVNFLHQIIWSTYPLRWYLNVLWRLSHDVPNARENIQNKNIYLGIQWNFCTFQEQGSPWNRLTHTLELPTLWAQNINLTVSQLYY